MLNQLPRPVAGYVSSGNTGDSGDLASWFASDALVRDEGRIFEGLDAIKAWHAEARRQYHHTVEPLVVANRDGRTILTARVSGDFPGSPVDLEHVFEIAGDKIISLEIR